MHSFRLFFFLFSFFLLNLYALEEYFEPKEVATTEGLPSSIVNGCVCAITGEYIDSMVDLVLPGPQPLIISRVYNSFTEGLPWLFNSQDQVIMRDVYYKGKPSYVFSLQEASGAQLDYSADKNDTRKRLPLDLIVPKGLTNSNLSGKTNLKNQTIHYVRDEDLVIVKSGAGNRKYYKRNKEKHAYGYPIAKQTYEEKINGSKICYKGDAKGISSSSEIICENQKTGKKYSSVTFDERGSNQKDVRVQTLTSSDGRKLYYYFKRHHYWVTEKEKNGEHSYTVDRYYLFKVDHPYSPLEKYEYSEKTLSKDQHISAKTRDDGRRFLHISYYKRQLNQLGGTLGNINIEDKDDFRLDRVKVLRAPVGVNRQPRITYRFDYHAQIKKESDTGRKNIGSGYTDVYDANNHKTTYTYDDKHRLTSITRYSGSETYTPYTKEIFKWDKDGNLSAKYFKDGKGNIHHARIFSYDSFGNATSSALCGKLTGNTSPPLLLDGDGKLIENGYEKEVKRYIYSDDGLNLLLSENDAAGKTINYSYYPNSDRIQSKFICYDHAIRLREFYHYDANNALEKIIKDDGDSEEKDNSSHVTERHVTLIQPRKQAPVGLPEVIEEYADDFEKGLIILKKTKNSYSREGRLEKQEIFDANDQFAYALSWTYDPHGNLISETNALGINSSKEYNLATDNLIRETLEDITVENTYDFSNRLIEQREIHLHHTFVKNFHYDLLSQCKAKSDPYGNTTAYLYDDFGRVIETHFPEIAFNGLLTTPIEKKEYDIADFPILVTDPNGVIIKIEVNIRGQPTKIHYPDGSHDEMRYSVDGQLIEKTSKTGMTTRYVRDPLGRIKEEVIADIKKTKNRYNAFHLLQTIDPEGEITDYFYDKAGRLSETIRNKSRIEQFYDPLGRPSEIREYFEKEDYRATVKKYDVLDRVLEETLQDSEGRVLHFSCYGYDSQGNRTLSQTGDQKTITHYNSSKQPILMIDGSGNETHISYNYEYINNFGQKILQKTTTDPLGLRTVETHDALERLVEIVQLNPFGVKIARQALSYDLAGNQTEREDEVIEDSELKRSIFTKFRYNEVNQLIETNEAVGTPEQKITRTYYQSGLKEKLIKPDGNKIKFTYDTFDRIKTCQSSDIDYLYEYNLLDQVISVLDRNTGKPTKRTYSHDELKKEILANGLFAEYSYDRTGRALTLLFPDQTGIEYVYNAVDLKSIYRLNKGKRTYSHKYINHSLSGQVTQAKLPGNNETIYYQFDAQDRCISIQANAFQQTIPKDGFDPASNLLAFTSQNIDYAFSYDDYYHLKKETGHLSNSYAFDSQSNRTVKNDETFYYNALHQLVKQDIAYDLNGNIIQKGSHHYSYDAFDRLIEITTPEAKIKYTYDAFNRRLSKMINGEEELFLYQGQDDIGTWKNNHCKNIRLLGKNKFARTAAIEINGVAYAPLHDIRGNIVALQDLKGVTAETYRYTAFGEREILNSFGEILSHSKLANPWQYAGKRYDEESDLIPFGMRYYDPSLGRWTTPDPAGYIDGSNLYAYVHNNPLQYSDQYGLFIEQLFIKGITSYLEFDGLRNPIGMGEYSSNIYHFNIEDNLESNFNRLNVAEPFYRTQTYSANDMIKNPLTMEKYNFKPLPRGLKILFMNGIGNYFCDFKKSLIHLAELSGGYNVEGIFCPSYGPIVDIMCYFSARKGAAYEGTRELQNHIKDFYQNNPSGSTMLLFGHSRGVVYCKNGLEDSPSEHRQAVDMRAIAPGAYIDRHLCKSIKHYVSRDAVPLLDPVGRQRCSDTIIKLEPHLKADLNDHDFVSKTYRKPIKDDINAYFKSKL